MTVWRYGWTLAPLVAIVALGTLIVLQASRWIGGILIVMGVAGLLLVLLKELVERPERANALYHVEGKQVLYLYTYTEFLRLPRPVRAELMQDDDVVKWFKQETNRHGGDMLEAYGTSLGKMRHRFFRWVLNLLT